MLYRTIGENRICITQPTHAWVSGQLAQVWGNETFGSVTPHHAVCLGAEQHDIGWIPWESAPTLNPDTGYPHSFTEVAPEVHTKLWAGAKHLAMPMGRYVALLVSLHGTGLYERFTHWKRSPEATRIVETFLKQEKEFQQHLIAQLGQDPAYQPYVMPEAYARNQRLVATVDALSLAICMGVTKQQQFEQVPSATGETTLTLMSINDDLTQLWLEPWCFQANEVTVVFEGRILKEKANNLQTMRDQLAKAPWVTLTATLRPR
ncbi:MAG TPA: DUF3891 domain-containing protein [Cyanobacteria bacterium UBA11369]|nr:DUF3891 domain-containing protein [Cyanobacteria bacterium UBA11371]HBE31291.1 DUF3891 domain-containing protein [Cyanobacteria bacterium UBA11368]HBE53296.1 DUF3891 domain-containing protein [Cyanobacteria bacterium UBA11369]